MSNWELSDEHEAFRKVVRDFAEAEIGPHAAQWDRDHHFPVDVVTAMGDLGLFGLVFPERWGGSEGDFASLCVAIEELGRVDQSMGITLSAGVGLGANPIHQFGDEQQQDRWLPDLVAGRALGAFGLTEPDGGSDAGATRTRARLDGDEWVIDGSKAFITNCGTSITSIVTVTARTDDGISAFVIPAGTPGMIIEPAYDKLGWHASDTHGITLDNCRVPAENLLGKPGQGFRNFLAILDDGRIAISALALGCARACLEHAVEYAEAAQRVRRADRPVPGSGVPALRPRGGRRELAQPDVQGGVVEGSGPPDRPGGGDGQALLDRDRGARHADRDPGVRRCRVHRGDADRALLSRRQDPRDRRGDERDPAPRARPRPRPAGDLNV